MAHMLGLERLFTLRGPLRNPDCTELDLVLLEVCRPLMILAAFFTGRVSIMSRPGWEAPLSFTSGTPAISIATSDLSFLMDILAQLPALYQQCDDCVRFANDRPIHSGRTRLTMLYRSTMQLQQETQAWKQDWDIARQVATHEVSPFLKISDMTTTTHIDNVENAIILSMYHSTTILLANIPIALLRSGFQGVASPSPSALNSYIASDTEASQMSDVQSSIISICCCIEYLLQPLQTAQVPADFYLFFPLHIAHRAARQFEYRSEIAWLSNILGKTRSKYPMGVWANMNCEDRFNGLRNGMFG